ncbi:MAG: ThuA domain-containing protein [Cyclobacteriaceae bacterium]
MIKRMYLFFSLTILLLASGHAIAQTAQSIKALVIDGQNKYHKHWPEVTQNIRNILEQTNLFEVDVITSPPMGEDMSSFEPDFFAYDVVLSYYDGDLWSEKTQQNFEKYMREGGGFVVIHAGDNAFPEWKEFNRMIGLGGWGNRNERHGPYIYLSENGEIIRDYSAGKGGHHGEKHVYQVKIMEDHPITRGLPKTWMHAKDELYDMMRGPAENMTILASAFSSKEYGGTGRSEPMLMTIDYDKGRIFHTVLGHDLHAQSCVGFITTLQRGAEWAATGKVSQEVPNDFPSAEEVKVRTVQ